MSRVAIDEPLVATRRDLPRWLAGAQLASMPQAMAPLAFSLATVSLLGSPRIGAAMVTVMTACQILFAVPLGRLGDRFGAGRFLRWTLVLRALVVMMLAIVVGLRADSSVVIALAAVSGVANGAIAGSFRSLLSEIVPAERLPRAVALGATANEVVFVVGPVLAAVLAGAVPILPIGVMAVSSLGAAILLPVTKSTRGKNEGGRGRRGAPIPPIFLVWMGFALTGSAAVAQVEVGAVTLALRLGLPAVLAVVFTVALCVASVIGGVLATWRGHRIGRPLVLAMLITTMVGGLGVGFAPTIAVAIGAAVLVGLCLAPLATYYSLRAETSLPVTRRAEGFSWLRTAAGLGVAGASLLIAVAPLPVTAISIGLALVVVIVSFMYVSRSTTKTPSASQG